MVSFLKGLLVALKVDWFDRGQTLLVVLFPFLVGEGGYPLLVAVPLLSQDADQELIVLKGLGNSFLVGPDALRDLT